MHKEKEMEMGRMPREPMGDGLKRLCVVMSLLLSPMLLQGCGQDAKKAVNDPCINNSDCADDICHNGTCCSPNPADNGGPCQGPGNCKSFKCVSSKCAPGTTADGQPCRYSEECASKMCISSKCQAQPKPDAGVDAGVDATQPDMMQPDSLVPDSLIPDAAIPDAPAPDAALPDAPAPDAAVPDSLVPDVMQPDSLVPDSLMPDALMPDAFVPPTNVQIATSKAVHPTYGTPAVARGKNGYLVVWRSGTELYGKLVDLKGTPAATQDFLIASGNVSRNPAVAANGTDYLVVWDNVSKLFATVVTSTGTVKPAKDLNGKPPEGSPSVAFDGKNFLAAWQGEYGTSNHQIFGRQVSSAGVPAGSAKFTITDKNSGISDTSVASDGKTCLVVWHDKRGNGTRYEIFGRALGLSSNPLGTADQQISATASYNKTYPAVAAGPSHYLVAWNDYLQSTKIADIGGARVQASSTGTPYVKVLGSGDIPIRYGGIAEEYPAVAHDGKNFLVIWSENQSGTKYDIYGARILPNGTVLDTKGIPISVTSGYQRYPALTFGITNYLAVWNDNRKTARYVYGALVNP